MNKKGLKNSLPLGPQLLTSSARLAMLGVSLGFHLSLMCWYKNLGDGAWKGEEKTVQVEGIAGSLLF